MHRLERRSFLQLAAAALPFLASAPSSAENATTTGTIVGAGEDRYKKQRAIPTGTSAFKLGTQDTRGAMFAMEHHQVKKGGPPRHLHHNEDEWFYVLEGEYVVEVGGRMHHLKAGDSILGPREVEHAFAFVGADTGRLLITYSPAGQMEKFFDSRDVPGGTRPYVNDAATMRAYGMELLGPPIDVLSLPA